MDPITQQLLLGAAGAAGGDKVYVDDVFSTFLYVGNDTARSINNGINLGDSSVSLNGKTITDTTGGGADYSKLNNNIISSNNTDYYYNAAGNIDCYIDYGSAVVSGFYNLYPQGDASQSPPIVYNTPQSVTGYGSNNASSWTSLGTATFDTSDWSNGNPTKAVFTNETAYRYYRLEVAGNGKTLQEWHLGIGQAGKGGLVWIKQRSGSRDNILTDTERGASKHIVSNSAAAQVTSNNVVSAFNSNGFNLGTTYDVNQSPTDFVSWTFRKAPGFFDVVTWTGNDTPRTIAHNLGTVPGMIMVKRTNSGSDWAIYHRSLGNTHFLYFNSYASGTYAGGWNNTTPTSTHFTVGDGSMVNSAGDTYVAYVFAHDAAQFGTAGNESIIKCGSLTTGSGGVAEVNLGFEPQWLLVKTSTEAGGWVLTDSMRGFVPYGTTGTNSLSPATASTEGGLSNWGPTSTGFKLSYGGTSGIGMIYMAIRRPHKPPEAGTEVFAIDTRGGTSPTPPSFYSGFPVDFSLHRDTGNDGWNTSARLMGEKYVATQVYLQEETMPNALKLLLNYDDSEGMGTQTVTSSSEYNWMFKRAPSFMDVVTFSGTGSNLAVNHNLDAIPELILHKNRTSATNWVVSATPLYSSGKILNLSSNGGPFGGGTSFMTSTPTASQILLSSSSSTVNASGNNYIQFLFATLSGISKVGTYSGTGNAINVDCGFTNGARFIMIKRIDEDVTGDWYVWDTLRGIVSGNDPYLFLNSTAAQVTNTDYIDPLSTGFTVTSSAPAALNTSGGTYLFLAIA